MAYLDSDTYEKLEADGAQFIEDFGVRSYPLDIAGLMRHIGIKFIPYSLVPVATKSLLQIRSRDAVTLAPLDWNPNAIRIVYNDHMKRERIRFTFAHEMAHIILEHPSDDEPYESAANYLARYILAPWPVVLEHSRLDVNTIQNDFDVSFECAIAILNRAISRKACGRPYSASERMLIDQCVVGGVVKLLAVNKD